MDTIILDPELASIAQRVHKEAEMRGGTPLDDQGGPEQVQIKVLWKPHPLNPEGRSETWDIEQKRVGTLTSFRVTSSQKLSIARQLLPSLR